MFNNVCLNNICANNICSTNICSNIYNNNMLESYNVPSIVILFISLFVVGRTLAIGLLNSYQQLVNCHKTFCVMILCVFFGNSLPCYIIIISIFIIQHFMCNYVALVAFIRFWYFCLCFVCRHRYSSIYLFIWNELFFGKS